MASQIDILSRSFMPAADLSSGLYHFVKVSGDNQVNIGDASTRPVGVLVEPNKSGVTTVPVGVRMIGTVKVVAGGAISAGGLVVSNASGKAIARTTEAAELIKGIALEAASADGDIIEIVLI